MKLAANLLQRKNGQVSTKFVPKRQINIKVAAEIFFDENDDEYRKQNFSNKSMTRVMDQYSTVKVETKNVDELIHFYLAVSAIENGDECCKHNISTQPMA